MKLWKSCTADNLAEYEAFVKELDARIGAFLYFDAKQGVEMSMKAAAADPPADPDSRGTLGAPDDPDSRGTLGAPDPLCGLPFAVKDNIAVRSMPLTCGSKFLENYISPYNATVIERLRARGAVPVGKTNLDEFGMGSSTDNSALQQTNNPWDEERVSGGSSGGSAAAAAAGMVPFALGSDTGGSVRQPAAFCGIYGLKPTYASVSRYGLVAYASSLDVIGVLSGNLDLTRVVFEAIRGQDNMDQSSLTVHAIHDLSRALPKNFPMKKSGIRSIGFLKGERGLSDEVAEAYTGTVDYLKKSGYELCGIELPSVEYAASVYHIIAAAEASSNLARFNGIRYGNRPAYAENPDDLVRKARNAGFGNEVKLRILLGTYVLRSGFQDKYYQKAQNIRRKMRQNFNDMFSQVDVLLMPVFPTQAFPHKGQDNFQQRLSDRFTALANLTGVPALSCPAGLKNGLPCAVQCLAPAFHEHLLFEIAGELQKEFPVPGIPNDSFADFADAAKF